VSLGPVSPGLFTVVWRVTAVDTHKTQGTFSFNFVEQ
jgi:methionine-rich copper-binding protein CopC